MKFYKSIYQLIIYSALCILAGCSSGGERMSNAYLTANQADQRR